MYRQNKIPSKNTPIQFDINSLDSDQISLNIPITLKELDIALSKSKN